MKTFLVPFCRGIPGHPRPKAGSDSTQIRPRDAPWGTAINWYNPSSFNPRCGIPRERRSDSPTHAQAFTLEPTIPETRVAERTLDVSVAAERCQTFFPDFQPCQSFLNRVTRNRGFPRLSASVSSISPSIRTRSPDRRRDNMGWSASVRSPPS